MIWLGLLAVTLVALSPLLWVMMLRKLSPSL